MPEFIRSAEIAFEAAFAANEAFDVTHNPDLPQKTRDTAAAEFSILVKQAGVVFAPPDLLRKNDEEQEQESELRKRLAMPIPDLLVDLETNSGFAPVSTPQAQRLVLNAIARENITTMRDVLALGRDEISDLRNIDAVSVNFIQEVIRAIDHTLEWWPDASTNISQIAKLYSSPEQIPARIISPLFDKTFAEDTYISTVADLLKKDVRSLSGIMQSYRWAYAEEAVALEAERVLGKARTLVDEVKNLHTS